MLWFKVSAVVFVVFFVLRFFSCVTIFVSPFDLASEIFHIGNWRCSYRRRQRVRPPLLPPVRPLWSCCRERECFFSPIFIFSPRIDVHLFFPIFSAVEVFFLTAFFLASFLFSFLRSTRVFLTFLLLSLSLADAVAGAGAIGASVPAFQG